LQCFAKKFYALCVYFSKKLIFIEVIGPRRRLFFTIESVPSGRLSRSVLSIFIKRWTIFFYMSCHEFPMKISHCSNPRLSIVTPLVQVFQRHSFAKALILHPLMRAGQQSISLRSTFQYISDTL